jgi:hypothetical protein
MNKLHKFIFVICLLTITFLSKSYAQTLGGATMTNDLVITLSGELSSSRFFASYKDVPFKSEMKAQSFWATTSDNIIAFEFSKDSAHPNGVFITLRRQYAPASWTLVDWNKYLQSKSAYFKSLFNKINNE